MPNMQLAINHLIVMGVTHHIVSFKKFVIPDGREYVPGTLMPSIEHRRVDIMWAPGGGALVESWQLSGLMADYKDSGFRCIDIGINGLTSSLRLVKGDVSLAEEYRIKLETRCLTQFNVNVQDSTIKMEFVPRSGGDEELTFFEKTKLPFLETIQAHASVYGKDYATIQIINYHKKAGHVVEFNIKDDPQIPSTPHVDTPACTECKGTGVYYPLVGPPEPCQTCQGKSKTAIPAFAQNVSRMFTEHLHRLLGPKVKSAKSYGYGWQICRADISCSKDHDQPGPIAQQAAEMIHGHLVKQYSAAIAFQDVYGDPLPDTTKNEIHMRSNYQGVSAWVSVDEIGQALQFQFSVRVSP